jgi:diguanylate cyclase (GGDEF)-like protein/PAS domain S-box-containing protein
MLFILTLIVCIVTFLDPILIRKWDLLVRGLFVTILCVLPVLLWIIYFRKKAIDLQSEIDTLEKLRIVLNNSQVGTYIIQDERLVYVNKRYSDLFGYQQEEVYQKDFFKNALSNEVYNFIQSRIEKRIKGERIETSYSFPVRRKDKEVRIVEVFPMATNIDGRPAITGIVVDVTERDRLKNQLEESERKYKSLFENSPDIICSFDLQGNFISTNPAGVRILGREITELKNIPIAKFTHPKDIEKALYYFEQAKSGVPQTFKIRVFHRNGKIVPLEITMFPMIINEEIVGLYSIAKDITQEQDTFQLLEDTKKKFDSIFESTLDAIFEMNSEGRYVQVNNVTEKITGYTKEELVKLFIKDLVVPDKVQGAMDAFLCAKGGKSKRLETTIRSKEGHHVILDVNAIPFKKENGDVHVISFAKDITERKKVENELKELAYKDSLTGLPNRYLFREKLTKAIEIAKESKQVLGILFIDYDNFKNINDTLGHDVGDMLLQEVVSVMEKCIRKQDLLSRQGGDEFLIMLEDIDEEDASKVAERILHELKRPIDVSGNKIFITPSIGISMYPKFGFDADSLIKHADMAMYMAKEKGKNNYQFFTDMLENRVIRKLRLENAMRWALDKEEFSLVYQPQFNLVTGEVVGIEALLRWNPTFGFVSPAEFIPIAEETGLIVEIGKFVMREACKKNKEWHESGLIRVPISVNVSARQFKESKFTEMVSEILTETDLPPSLLEIEITESVMLDVEEASEVITQLKKRGLKIAIDDFGVGYSSLNIIKEIEIDNLKIDQSFMRDVMHNDKSAGLLEAIIQMGRKIGADVVVEGVETVEQVNFLQPYGVIGQGYYFSRPLSDEDFEQFVKKQG